jgi:hypothetical protein
MNVAAVANPQWRWLTGYEFGVGMMQPNGAPWYSERLRAQAAGSRYLTSRTGHDVQLPTMPSARSPVEHRLVQVAMPDWAHDLGVGVQPSLLVDAACLTEGTGPAHERCDWLLAAFLHLDSWLERSWEARHGPIHSYAARLPAEWSSAFDRAWANRIFLFLRRWAARQAGLPDDALFAPLPKPRFVLTHDVDALRKTIQLRIKSSVMSAIATTRHMRNGQWRQALKRIRLAARYVVMPSDYRLLNRICEEEAARGFRSCYMFADNRTASGLSAWLIDPSYTVAEPRIGHEIRHLQASGWFIGAHPGFHSWNDASALAATRGFVSEAAGMDVRIVRQHWLRFSFANTWEAQHKAGFTHDFTLGFNDRAGLRNGAALRWRPARPDGSEIGLEVIPTLLMDSHFYDYDAPQDPAAAMRPWIDEVIHVHGEASLLWHSQTMHDDYGWAPGYLALLDMLGKSGADVTGPVP